MNSIIAQLLLFLALSLQEDSNKSDLYLKIKSGDKDAFRQFFDEHYPALYRYLLSKGTAPGAAEDLVQQAFIYIWEHRHKIDEQQSLKAYLFRIGYTRMLNRIRDRKKYSTEETHPDETFESGMQTDDALMNRELAGRIEAAINALPDKRQQVFRLCFLEDFTYKQAAETLEVSVKTIENHMALALKDLRNTLAHLKK